MTDPPEIALELLPEECAILLAWKVVPACLKQVEACAAGTRARTILFTRVDIHFMSGDLTHYILERGCDEDVFDLSERLEYVEETGDGALDSWY